MKSTSVRLSEERLGEIRSLGMSVGEFVREAVDRELTRRSSPGADSSGPRRKETLSTRDLPSIDGESGERISKDLDLRIAACGEVMFEAIMALSEHSIPRRLCFVDELTPGAQARYENSGETFVAISQSRYPEIMVATGDDFIPLFELQRVMDIPMEMMGENPAETIRRTAREVGLELARDESRIFASLLNDGTLPRNRVRREPSGEYRVVSSSGDFACEGIPHNRVHLLDQSFAEQCVLSIRQNVTSLPIDSEGSFRCVTYEEIGLGLFDRSLVVTVEEEDFSGFVRPRD